METKTGSNKKIDNYDINTYLKIHYMEAVILILYLVINVF